MLDAIVLPCLEKVLAILNRRSHNIASLLSVLHQWTDENATDSRRLQDGDLHHEWFVALKV